MKKFAVIGDPISHSLSPTMHGWIFNELNINATYEKVHVRKNQLNEIINKMNEGILDGINVTLPHKTNIISYLDEINPRAKLIGAINMVMKVDSKIIGNNTDWYGFMMAMKGIKLDLDLKLGSLKTDIKSLRKAARQAIVPELARRVNRIIKNEIFELRDDHKIYW